MDDYPIVKLHGLDSDRWEGAYQYGLTLDELFPGQDGTDFSYACSENSDYGPLTETVHLAGLLCVQHGENDEEDWVWLVATTSGEHWVLTGGCDYTGWDCQSYVRWERYIGGES